MVLSLVLAHGSETFEIAFAAGDGGRTGCRTLGDFGELQRVLIGHGRLGRFGRFWLTITRSYTCSMYNVGVSINRFSSALRSPTNRNSRLNAAMLLRISVDFTVDAMS